MEENYLIKSALEIIAENQQKAKRETLLVNTVLIGITAGTIFLTWTFIQQYNNHNKIDSDENIDTKLKS